MYKGKQQCSKENCNMDKKVVMFMPFMRKLVFQLTFLKKPLKKLTMNHFSCTVVSSFGKHHRIASFKIPNIICFIQERLHNINKLFTIKLKVKLILIKYFVVIKICVQREKNSLFCVMECH